MLNIKTFVQLSSWRKPLTHLRRIDGVLLAIILLSVTYFAVRGTPSSFGIVRMQLGLSDGNLLGISQGIRSDEYSTWTPKIYIGETVRENQGITLSPYKETIEPIYPIPTNGWRALFKPLMYGFHFLPFDFAYSLHWTLCIFGAFTCSYLLGKKLFKNKFVGVAFASLLIFNSAQQTWLTVLGINGLLVPICAYLIIKVSRSKLSVVAGMLLGACFAASTPYLAGLPQANIVVFCFLLVFESIEVSLKRTLITLGAFVSGQILYICSNYEEWLKFTSTAHPGLRAKSGGNLSFTQFVAQFMPNYQYAGWIDLNNLNVCESSTFGNALFLPLIFIMVRHIHKKKFQEIIRREYWKTYVLTIILLLVFVWQLFDFASIVGNLTLMDRSAEQRSVFLTGPILLLLIFRLFFVHNLINLINARIAVYSGLVIGVLGLCNNVKNANELQDLKLQPSPVKILFWFDDFLFLFMVVLGLLCPSVISKLKNRGTTSGKTPISAGNLTAILLTSATFANFAIWAPFNPILPAQKILEVKNTEFAKDLSLLREKYKQPIILPGFSETQNGWLEMISPDNFQRVLPMPPLGFWEKVLTKKDFIQSKEILNRYAYVSFSPELKTPQLVYLDSIKLPTNWMINLAAAPDVLITKAEPDYREAEYISQCSTEKPRVSTKVKLLASAKVPIKNGDTDFVYDIVLESNQLRSYKFSHEAINDSSVVRIKKVVRFTELGNEKIRFPEMRINYFQIVVTTSDQDTCFKLYLTPYTTWSPSASFGMR